MAILDGLLLGLMLSIMIGPVFFMLLQVSLEKGFFQGLIVALGINASDITYILLLHWGTSYFIPTSFLKSYIPFLGGSVLIVFGLLLLLRKENADNSKDLLIKRNGNGFRYFTKGYLINLTSPFVPIFWWATVSMVSGKYGLGSKGDVFFFVTALSTVLSVDMGKVYLAGRLKKLIIGKVLRGMNVTIGILLMAFGLRLFFYEL